MDKGLLVPFNSKERSILAMGGSTSTLQGLCAAPLSATRGLCSRPPQSRSHRGDDISPFSGAPLHGSEEKLGQKKSYPGSVDPESEYLLSVVQNDDGQGRKGGYPKGSMGDLHRPKGRLLAYPHQAVVQEILGIQPQQAEIPVSGDAVWSKYSPKNFYKNDKTDFDRTTPQRSQRVSLPRRLACLGRIRGRVSESNTFSSSDLGEKRVPGKLPKVSSHTLKEVRVAWNPVEHRGSYVISPGGEGHLSLSRLVCFFQQVPGVAQTSREDSGEVAICFPGGSNRESPTKIPQSLLPPPRQERVERQTSSSTPKSEKRSIEMVETGNSEFGGSISPSASIHGHLHRCLEPRLGHSDVGRTVSQGRMVPRSEGMSYQHFGAGRHLPSSKEAPVVCRVARESSLRQHHGSELHKPTRISQVQATEFVDPLHPSCSEAEGLGHLGLSCAGSPKRPGRQPVQERPSAIRMDSRSRVLHLDLSTSGNSRSGLVCDKEECQTTSVCFTCKGCGSMCYRCFHSRLESMGDDLPLSANKSNSQSAKCVRKLSGQSSFDRSDMAQPELVPSAHGQGQGEISDTSTRTIPSDRRKDLLESIKNAEKSSLLDFLSVVYTGLYSSDSAKILIHSVRRSTSKQYDSVWSAFCSYLKAYNVSVVSTESVLSFLRFLFYVKKLAPATISAYKSALVRPLRLAFGIDVTLAPFPEFVRALFNIRPNKPVAKLSWSLDRALDLALSPRFQCEPQLEDSLMLSLFLLSLATGGRVSELQALLRAQDFLSFEDRGMTLYPNPNFLAKNENPAERRGPIFISSLFNEDGTPHPLCPVNNVKLFLELSKNSVSMKLFVKPSDLSDLPIGKIRWYLCKFIRLADPTSFPKVHDLRKIASSFAFFRHMGLEEICSLTGWSSFRVFRKHYLHQIKAIKSSIVVLGSTLPGSAKDM